MNIQLRHLRLVQHVAREGTVTAAARTLHLTQSALSHQLAELERRIGAPVFERLGRGMALTPVGRRLLAAAEHLLPAAHAVEQDVADIVAGRRGLLRLTAECFTCYHWLPDVLPGFRESHPGVDVRLVPEASVDPVEALLRGDVDVALSYDPRDEPRLRSRRLFTDEQVLLVPPRHPLAERPWVEAADFRDQHLLMYLARPDESLFFRSVLRPAGVEPARTTEVRLTEGILALVRAGEGVSVMTRWTAAPDIAAGRVIAVPIGPGGLRREWRAFSLARSSPVPHLEAFLDILGHGPPGFDPAAPRASAPQGDPPARSGEPAGRSEKPAGDPECPRS